MFTLYLVVFQVSVIPKERKSFPHHQTPLPPSHSQTSFVSFGGGLAPPLPPLASHTPTTSLLFQQLRDNMKDLEEIHQTLQSKLGAVDGDPIQHQQVPATVDTGTAAVQERVGEPCFQSQSGHLARDRTGHHNGDAGHCEESGERTGHRRESGHGGDEVSGGGEGCAGEGRGPWRSECLPAQLTMAADHKDSSQDVCISSLPALSSLSESGGQESVSQQETGLEELSVTSEAMYGDGSGSDGQQEMEDSAPSTVHSAPSPQPAQPQDTRHHSQRKFSALSTVDSQPQDTQHQDTRIKDEDSAPSTVDSSPHSSPPPQLAEPQDTRVQDEAEAQDRRQSRVQDSIQDAVSRSESASDSILTTFSAPFPQLQR